MIRVDVLIVTSLMLLLAAFALAESPESNRGCIASAYQAELRGFDLQENLAPCYGE
jgi:hypothetical protein